MKKLFYAITFLCTIGFASAQDFSGLVNSYFNQNRSLFELEAQDITDVRVENHYFSKSTSVYHVYAVQYHQGIEVFNATANFAVKNNAVYNAEVGFISRLAEKVNTTNPAISPAEAVQNTAAQLGLNAPGNLQLLDNPKTNSYLFSSGNISQEDIPVKLVFQPIDEFTSLRLAWDLSIALLDGSHWYSVRVDAVTGRILDIHDWITHCTFDIDAEAAHKHIQEHKNHFLFKSNASLMTPNDGSVYRVFPIPFESPSHGPESLESQPADANASPFGWHDTNGVPGPEFTTTRGNNVSARADLAGNNSSGNYSPDGGADLTFDFNYNFSGPPSSYTDASTTNLFYWNNIIHDMWYQYGFDEASGNFQENNYGNGGLGNDSVNADSQDGAGMNNANFGTPPEGQRPRMNMFLWSPQGQPGNPLTINNGSLAGTYFGIAAGFGNPLPYTTPITADLALTEDDNSGESTDIYDACDNITNAGSISGKIAVIRRGTCEFGFKVFQAQNAGAVAAIVVNNEGGAPIAMGPGDYGGSVTIPSIMVTQADGEAIITALINGETINASLIDAGPYAIDGSLDNGIIAHEYGHGISNRLTGGSPFNVGCLQNDEQMGEGWSDWIGLMMTIKEGDLAEDRRGIGTYATGQPTTGNGIRPAPYSTSFSINPYTYGHTNNGNISQPHGIGFVWATMLWDLTWALIDEYGFDPDLYYGTGGNNIAMQLVIDGLKLQPCSPGFVNGRDAILLADELANGGANRCLIWNVFAKRGLGLSASQGSSFNRFDQTEAFDVPEDCVLSTPGHSLNNFSIYPNPTDGNVSIHSVKDMGASVVSVFDINGRKVFSQEIVMNGTVSLDINELKTGLYIVKLDGDNYTHTFKLIVK